jgi:hypothetical protein
MVSQSEERWWGENIVTYFASLLISEERHGTQSFLKWKFVTTDNDIIIMEVI